MLDGYLQKYSSVLFKMTHPSSKPPLAPLDDLMLWMASSLYIQENLVMIFGDADFLSAQTQITHLIQVTIHTMTSLFLESMWSSEDNCLLDNGDGRNRDGGIGDGEEEDGVEDDFFKVDVRIKTTNYSIGNWNLTMSWFNHLFDKYFNDYSSIESAASPPSPSPSLSSPPSSSSSSSSPFTNKSPRSPSTKDIYSSICVPLMKESLGHYTDIFMRWVAMYGRDNKLKMNELRSSIKMLTSTCCEMLLRSCSTPNEILHPIHNNELYGLNVNCARLMTIVESLDVKIDEGGAKVGVEMWFFLANQSWKVYKHPTIILAHEMFVRDPINKKSLLLQLLFSNDYYVTKKLLALLMLKYDQLTNNNNNNSNNNINYNNNNNNDNNNVNIKGMNIDDGGVGDGGGMMVMKRMKRLIIMLCELVVQCDVDLFNIVEVVARRCFPGDLHKVLNKTSPIATFCMNRLAASMISFVQLIFNNLELEFPKSIVDLSTITTTDGTAPTSATTIINPAKTTTTTYNIFPEDRLCCGCRPTSIHLLRSLDEFLDTRPEDMEEQFIEYCLQTVPLYDERMLLFVMDCDERFTTNHCGGGGCGGGLGGERKSGSLLYEILTNSLSKTLRAFRMQPNLMKDGRWDQTIRACEEMVRYIMVKKYDPADHNFHRNHCRSLTPNSITTNQSKWRDGEGGGSVDKSYHFKIAGGGSDEKEGSKSKGMKKMNQNDDGDGDADNSGGGGDDDNLIQNEVQFEALLVTLDNAGSNSLELISRFIVNNNDAMKQLYIHAYDDGDDDRDGGNDDGDDDNRHNKHHHHHQPTLEDLNLNWNFEDVYVRSVRDFNFLQ